MGQGRDSLLDRPIVLKKRKGLPALTTDRVADFIAMVRAGDVPRGLDPDQAQRLWSDLIEAAITHGARAFGARAFGARAHGARALG